MTTTVSVSAGRGYVFVAEVFGGPDTITEASLPSTALRKGDPETVGEGSAIFENADAWYGDVAFLTFGNAPGSIGFAGQPSSAPATTVGSGGFTFPLDDDTVPISDCAALNADGGSFTAGEHIVVYSGRSTSSGAGNATGCHSLPTATGTVAAGTTLGYTAMRGGAAVDYMKFGDVEGGSNRPIPGTTQGRYGNVLYYGPTVNDVMEGDSFSVQVKDTGTGFTQKRSVVAREGIAQVEGANVLSGGSAKLVAFAGTIKLADESHTDRAEAFLAQVALQDDDATAGQVVGFHQAQSFAHVGNTGVWGVKVQDAIETADSLFLNPSDGDGLFKVDRDGVTVSNGSTPFARLRPRSDHDHVTLRVEGATGQTKNLEEWWAVGATSATSWVTSAGAHQSSQGYQAMSGSTVMFGVTSAGPKWYQASLEQTTVGAAGGATALPATPTKYLLVRDRLNNTLVIPAYAAG